MPDISSIFWPIDLLNPSTTTKLLIVGYQLHNKTVIIDLVKLETLDELNLKFTDDFELSIIGVMNVSSSEYRIFSFNNGKPILSDTENLILFKPPQSKKLEYYSIDPIIIDIFWNNNSASLDSSKKEPYSKKLSHHFPKNDKNNDLKDCLKFINLTNYSRFKLSKSVKKKSKINYKFIVSSSNYILFLISYIYSMTIQRICLVLTNILSYQIKTSSGKKLSLASSSFLLHQLNFRFKQFYNLPTQFQKLKNSKIESEKLIIKGTRFSPSEYIKFYNTLWLILNDLLLGLITSNSLAKHHEFITEQINSITTTFHQTLFQMINWLMNSPAGFKLNNELSSFFGDLFIWVLTFWNNSILTLILKNTSIMLTIISFLVKYGGLTILFAALIDVINIITFQIYCFYFASTRVFNWQSHILRSLFRLFYGKKYNILRNRIDNNDYEFDQLLFGIIIFTMLVYLMPTVIAFYLNFVVVRMLCMASNLVLEAGLITLNHLPIVVFLLKLKNKDRLPGGVVLNSLVDSDHNGLYFQLLTESLSLKEILKSHFKSMFDFNLINLKEFYDECDDISVIENWKRFSVVGVARKVVLGELIELFEYRKMF
ncbi:hypothetical protein CANARDRAFT_6908 [[Candida] arabinofermentans NRRL YB-2248]|uniref:Uncharacterized protein n=1 Tax=[Candida] arabinofermentans NRRL YB-2248 TaxID=983967 RepID=A0A1E4T3U6_9ASCO|nr:hypothetical protein CANARDRAFT_6908 [[Candida] arabinofermentans NRRL YB-2248]